MIKVTADMSLEGKYQPYTLGMRNKPRDSFSFYFLIAAAYTDELFMRPE